MKVVRSVSQLLDVSRLKGFTMSSVCLLTKELDSILISSHIQILRCSPGMLLRTIGLHVEWDCLFV